MCSTGQLITALFGLVLALSIQDAVAQDCPFSTLLTKDNAIHDGGSPPDAAMPTDTVTYTCASGYRIAPDSTPAAFDTMRTVTCGSVTPGVFSDLDFECVPILPTSCRDYFTRDRLLPLATIAVDCFPVTISHPGPPVTTTLVDCCKRSTTSFRTRIDTVGVTDAIPETGTCTGSDASDIMLGVTFDGTISTLCDPAVQINYPLTEAEIRNVVATTHGCTQRVRFNCHTGGGSTSKAIIIRYNGDDVGTLYGTNAFPEQGVNIDLSHYGNTGAACDCALLVTEAAGTCVNGCHCTQMGAVAPERDTMTRDDITPTNLKYVTHVRVSQHNNAGTTVATTIDVRNIQCNEDL